jgi:hypothetical protein
MTMTREEREFAQQVSDETKDDRRKAIAAAGPLFNAARQDTLERMLTGDCRLEKPYVSKVMSAFADAGNDDDADLKESITKALAPYVGNKTFLAREAAEIEKVVKAAQDERDQKIVAAGGADGAALFSGNPIIPFALVRAPVINHIKRRHTHVRSHSRPGDRGSLQRAA